MPNEVEHAKEARSCSCPHIIHPKPPVHEFLEPHDTVDTASVEVEDLERRR